MDAVEHANERREKIFKLVTRHQPKMTIPNELFSLSFLSLTLKLSCADLQQIMMHPKERYEAQCLFFNRRHVCKLLNNI